MPRTDAATMPSPPPRPLRMPRPILFAPGLVFWGLVGAGLATDNDGLLGAAVVVAVAVAAGAITLAVKASGAARAERHRIWTEGAPARARVVSIGTDGGSFNDHPWVDLTLEVTPEGAAPYPVTVRALISTLAIPRIQPGCDITVHVDRADRGRVVVDAALTPYGYRR